MDGIFVPVSYHKNSRIFTVSQERFSNATYMLCLILMLIGGSPMGTAGGIKTTTVAVLLLSLKSNLQENGMWKYTTGESETAISVLPS